MIYDTWKADTDAITAAAIAQAGEAGLTIYPVKLPSGNLTYGLHKVGPGASKAIAGFKFDAKGRGTVIGAEIARSLAETLRINHKDHSWRLFNAIASARLKLPLANRGMDRDRYLIKACKKLRRVLAAEKALSNLLADNIENFERDEPPYPTFATTVHGRECREDSSARMKQHLKRAVLCSTKTSLKGYRARIKRVAEYERQIAALRKKYNLAALERRAAAYLERIEQLTIEIATLPAMTMLGTAWKASLTRPIYDLFCSMPEWLSELSLSIADDARMLGTGSALRDPTPEKAERYMAPQTPTEAYHAVAAE